MINHTTRRQSGASTIEFLIVAPVLAAIGLGTVQAGLAYHGKTILNYATFEAARTGAVNHALQSPMRRELAIRLAPLIGGDGSDEAAALAVGVSLTSMTVDPFTRIAVLSPSVEAFEHFQIRSRESGRQVIPNSHLRFRDDAKAAIDPVSGVDLRDANLLKIKVTHGFDMKVPLVGAIAAPLMSLIDPKNTLYYQAGKLPLSSVATVRMQSEVWGDSLVSMNTVATAAEERPPGESGHAPPALSAPDENSVEDGLQGEESDGEDAAEGDARTGCDDPFLASDDPMLPTVDPSMCSGSGTFGAVDDASPASPLPDDDTMC